MKHIRVCREAAGLSQRELAVRIGVAQPAVSQMEEAENYPDARRLPTIADALGCSIDALFGRGEPAPIIITEKEDEDNGA